MRSRKAVIAMLMVCMFFLQPLATKAADANAINTLTLCNQQRKAVGLADLKWNTDLANAAAVRSSEIQQVWSHTRPDGTAYFTADDAIYGENLSKDCTTPEECVANWMSSPQHRANILDPTYRSCGVSVYEVNGSWYCAEEFGY